MTRQEQFIDEARAHTRAIWNAVTALQGLQREHAALDYGSNGNLPDGTGANAGVTAAEVGAVVFDTTNAIVAVLDAGHATNMAKLL